MIATYARRRPWRILPPYWAALGFSPVMTWYVLPQPAIVVTVGVLGPHVALMNTALVKFTPDLAVLFAVGLLASGIVTAGERTRSRPWAGYALAAAVPAIGCFVTAVAASRPRFVVRPHDSRLPRSLGSCSYSLYLTHAPIVAAVSLGLVGGRVTPGTPMFFVLVAILLPVTVCFAQMFATAFELPFQRHHGWIPLRQAMSARLCRWRRDACGSPRG